MLHSHYDLGWLELYTAYDSKLYWNGTRVTSTFCIIQLLFMTWK